MGTTIVALSITPVLAGQLASRYLEGHILAKLDLVHSRLISGTSYTTQTLWRAALAGLAEQMTKANFATWLMDTPRVSIDTPTAVIVATDAYQVKWLEARFLPLIQGVDGRGGTAMSRQRVLVVDDEPQVRRMLREVLAGDGYEVQLAASGEEALNFVASDPPAAVILDLMLPDMSGLDVCKELRNWRSLVPIIVVSARTEERAKVEALDLGADDYLTKPFGVDEFLARLRAALRRGPGQLPTPTLASGELQLDQVRRVVTLRGREVHLTPTEYEILRYLMANAGRIVTYPTLLRAAWGPGYEDNIPLLRVFVTQLRHKVEPDPNNPSYIHTEPRIGYRFRWAP